MAVTSAQMLTLARKLPIPVPWDRNVLIDNLARERGRPIRLIPTDFTSALTDGPCGLWLTLDDADLILHEAGTTDYHIDQIVAHEIGHMVLGHNRLREGGDSKSRDNELCRAILPDIDPATVRAVLGRKNYITDQERDAEIFASMLMITAAEVGAHKSMMKSVFFGR